MIKENTMKKILLVLLLPLAANAELLTQVPNGNDQPPAHGPVGSTSAWVGGPANRVIARATVRDDRVEYLVRNVTYVANACGHTESSINDYPVARLYYGTDPAERFAFSIKWAAIENAIAQDRPITLIIGPGCEITLVKSYVDVMRPLGEAPW
jgi:hypothetical protein